MKIKWPVFVCLILLAIAGCKKDQYINHKVNPATPVKLNAHLSIANLLQSNMVIQRNKPLIIWGTAAAFSKIAVKVSWVSNTLQATADSLGNWKVSAQVGAANTSAKTINVSTPGVTSITLDNILIGDVWICSGQSNMVMPVDSIAPYQGVTNFQTEIAEANYPNIRALSVATDYAAEPVDTLLSPAQWTVCSPQTAGAMSAVAYFFARKLNTELGVPIGIIISAVDGTSCEAWTNQTAFNANPYLATYSSVNNATQLYNGMINPLAKLFVSGFIWYQGENNKNNDPVSDYTKLNSALITGWRNIFGQGTLPFYFVQMPPFAQDYFNTNPVGGDTTKDSYAKFREAQANILAMPNTGMAVTMDIGIPSNQHLPNKKPVGERLALLALKNTYSQNAPCYGPQYWSFSTNGSTVAISFKSGTATGLNTINNTALKQYFYVAGSNRVFVQASAKISNDQIILTVPAGFNLPVVAVRYAFSEAPVTNLQNSAGLPAEPFRTDAWSN